MSFPTGRLLRPQRRHTPPVPSSLTGSAEGLPLPLESVCFCFIEGTKQLESGYWGPGRQSCATQSSVHFTSEGSLPDAD